MWTHSNIEDARVKSQRSERRIRELTQYEQTLNSFLRRYGVEVNVMKVGENIFRVPTAHVNTTLDSLPEGLVYIGGAARSVLERSLSVNMSATPRDIDIAHDAIEIDDELKHRLSKQYMTEDYSHGHGISPLGVDYFETRDFTRNEVLFDGQDIFCTKECLLDTVRKIIRFSQREKKQRYFETKLLAKAVRFLAQDSDMKFVEKEILLTNNIAPFYIALHLDRAIETGNGVAEEYIRELRNHNQIPVDIHSVRALQQWIDEHLSDPFVYRNDYVVESFDDGDQSFDEYDWLPLQESPKKYGHK
jgi:hypothetical protein